MAEEVADEAAEAAAASARTARAGTVAPAKPASDLVRRWACVAAWAATTKTDAESVVLEVAPVLSIVEYFVVTSGRNARQVKALVDEIEEQVTKAGGPKPARVEGRDTHQWVLMDYGDFVVHVFLDEMRTFYDLEKLWADVPRVDWSAVVDALPSVDPAADDLDDLA